MEKKQKKLKKLKKGICPICETKMIKIKGIYTCTFCWTKVEYK